MEKSWEEKALTGHQEELGFGAAPHHSPMTSALDKATPLTLPELSVRLGSCETQRTHQGRAVSSPSQLKGSLLLIRTVF